MSVSLPNAAGCRLVVCSVSVGPEDTVSSTIAVLPIVAFRIDDDCTVTPIMSWGVAKHWQSPPCTDKAAEFLAIGHPSIDGLSTATRHFSCETEFKTWAERVILERRSEARKSVPHGLEHANGATTDEPVFDLRLARQRAERDVILKAVAVTGWNFSRASELLGVTRPTLYDLLKKHEIEVPTSPEE